MPDQSIQKRQDDFSFLWILLILMVTATLYILSPQEMAKEYHFDALFAAVIGLIFIYTSFEKLKRTLNAKKWSSTSATLIEKEVLTLHDSKLPLYFPYIRYHFDVDGQNYVSRRIAFYKIVEETPQAIEDFIEELTSDSLKAHYNPRYPEQSVLIPTLPPLRILFWSILFLLGTISIGLACYVI